MSPILTLLLLVLRILGTDCQQQQQQQQACPSSNPSGNDTQVLLSFLQNSFGTVIDRTDAGFEWRGRQLIRLNLSNRNLSGTLSSDWGNLPSLETLDLSSNNISGRLVIGSLCSASSLRHLNLSNNPLLGGAIPDISRLVKLEVLDLSSSSFSGEFPQISLPLLKQLNISRNKLQGDAARLSVSHELERLDASDNALVGKIPTSLMQLKSLKILNLSCNNFTGGIPDEIGQLQNMTRLVLSMNKLGGEIPESLGNCAQLSHIDLTSNQFTGGIPSTLAKLSMLTTLSAGYNNLSVLDFGSTSTGFRRLEALYLRNNFLQGPLTSSVGRLASLKFLVLQENLFSGPIPPELGNCSQLEEIWFKTNSFNGTIPEELFKLVNLRYLSLDINKLSGEIPDQFGKLPMLNVVWLEQNEFTGKLPQSLGSLTNLLMMAVSQNHLTGTIPPSFRNLTNLIGMDLGVNDFSGQLPDVLMHLSNLQFLFLSNNSFSGPIPEWIGKMRNLRALDMSLNSFTGRIPANLSEPKAWRTRGTYNTSEPTAVVHTNEGREYRGFAFPTTIDLSHNHLAGSIPKELGSLENLQVLTLSFNNLSGDIPLELGGSNKSLLRMDISNNQLTGEIPDSFAKLTFLQFLDVSNNHLRGEIPKFQLSTFPDTSYIGNDGLCGLPLTAKCVVVQAPREALQPSDDTRQARNIVTVILGVCGAVFLSGVLAMYFAMARRRHKLFSNGEGCEMMEDEEQSHHRRCRPFSMTFSDKLPAKICARQLAVATNNYSHANVVGDGGFGIVYKAVLDGGVVVAVKKLSSGGVQGDREFHAELQTLGNIRHPNLVPLLGYCRDGCERLLIYKYLRNGSLDTWLYCREPDVAALDWPTRLRIARGAAQGIAYLHAGDPDQERPSIIHRDIKVSNILLDENFEAHVADFGLARLVNVGDTHVSTDVAGTIGYIPPEYNHKCVANTQGDVYSFGVVCLEILTAKRPTDQFFRKIGPLAPTAGGGAAQLVAWVLNMRSVEEQRMALDGFMVADNGSSSVDGMLDMMRIACMCCREAPSKRPTMQEVATMLQLLEERMTTPPAAAAAS